ncbi:polyribonucleotide nucleotidyltransferase [Egibacter rhizosphaerae]|uniref:Polyribonucleotide nucleotidyltransferase n=1 Tax=Egibacter rhizosphaerae TaxID=1670831 RepID=A0A411YCL4_9ACTN|nr:polyribonucleotide nucleotidyltransferase [Egibacter rhizosphaerae]QBI18940.1 polyribonucleotide nucleotidyltransferase [Egibacter rhizosphaerae]
MGKLGTTDVGKRIGETDIRFEAGKLAGLAGGAVVAHADDTTLLVTTTSSAKPKEHLDFFPLTVDYEEKMYAAGRIPGSFFKREGRPSETAILTCRLVDRPMRPTFDNGLRNEIQIVITTLTADQVNPPDALAINGASVATMLAGIPFDGPVAGLRMAMDRTGQWHPFPTFQYLQNEAVFDLVVAGRLNEDSGEIDILMVEAEATEQAVDHIETGAVKPTEEVLADALEESKRYLRELCDLQLEFLEQHGRAETADYPLYPAYDPRVYEVVERTVGDQLKGIVDDGDRPKAERNQRSGELREQAIDAVFEQAGDVEVSDEQLEAYAKNAFGSLEKTLIRKRIVHDGVRIDGRGPTDIRPLSAEVGVLPKMHGTGLFQRGDTQVLNILTLGMSKEAQRLDTLDPETEKRYIHHYNFPPFSTGEAGFMRGPKRREIGHGALAERAVLPVVPGSEEFPYALRLVSEVLSSNGSTSMASVCASTLSLMDAGVPIHAPVSGIAMGLVNEDDKFVTLTDILGAEDATGDMDFKVAGTEEFVTALQLDTKLSGVSADILTDALNQARGARLKILEVMHEAIPEVRKELNPQAPRIITEYIPSDKVGEVIGPKGKIVNEIQDETGASISIDDVDGRGIVQIFSPDGEKAQMALDRIRQIANPVVPQEGERYYGTVVKTMDFGAFVSLTPGNDGLLHISKLGGSKRLAHADEAVSVGDRLWVEVQEVVDGKKFKLAPVEEVAAEGSGGGDAAPSGGGDAESSGDGGPEQKDREPAPAGGGGGRERQRGGGDDEAPRRERTRSRGGEEGDDNSEGGRRRRRRRS